MYDLQKIVNDMRLNVLYMIGKLVNKFNVVERSLLFELTIEV